MVLCPDRDRRFRRDHPRGLGDGLRRAARDADRGPLLAAVRRVVPRRRGRHLRALDRSPGRALGARRGADRRRRAPRHPVRRRPSHRAGALPPLAWSHSRPRHRRDVPHRGRRRHRGPLRPRVQLDRVGPGRGRGGADGSRGDVLRLRRSRDPRSVGDDPRGRGGRERPRRDRAHDRDDRARLRGGRQPLGRRGGVRRSRWRSASSSGVAGALLLSPSSGECR